MEYLRYLTSLLWATPTEPDSESDTSNALRYILAPDLPLPEIALQRLIECYGGSWPPEPTFKSSWPAPLQGYESTYNVVAPFLPVLNSSHDDAENRVAIDSMRGRISGLLAGSAIYKDFDDPGQCAVDLRAVQATLQQVEDGCWPGHTAQSMCNAMIGFCACLSFLRHSFRWGISPIVREAQIEKTVVMPPQLDIPWAFCQRYFGFTSAGGSVFTTGHSNTWGSKGQYRPYYSTVVGLPEAYQRTSHWAIRLFTEMELKSLPAYRMFASAITSCMLLTDESPRVAASTLKETNATLVPAFRWFFDNFNETNMAREIWLPYVQGFTGWTLEGPDGVVVDGVSGGQSLAIRTFDAFLGTGVVPPPEIEMLHIPKAQRDWLNSLRDYNIRKRVDDVISHYKARNNVVKADEWEKVRDELNGLVRQLRLWRMGHMRRMMTYESLSRPERVRMTAGISLPPGEIPNTEETMMEHLKEVLREKLAATK
ncbi:hypothetical protein BDZ94DRAFT_1323710 [Collybia nuda]|uniref:Uncharacterized protein n=1 Tax=Collybia nuda TaxID=64659 RepID=A0A9P5Y459_9AGAR|nr:hypothetical protein BDZ94DRAFT_1323710 [Collybia nuda]